MSLAEFPTFGRGIEEKDNLPIFYRDMIAKLQNCGVPLKEGARMLEVGSGNGNFLNYLREKGVNAEGIDLAPRGPGVKKENIAALTYPSESFDYVVSKQVFDGALYNQDEITQKKMLSEITRVLKKGGSYYAVENFFEPIEGLRLLRDPQGNTVSSVYQKMDLLPSPE